MSFVQNINPNLRLLEFQSWRWEAHGEKVTIVKLENDIPFLGFDYSRGAILLPDGSNTPMRETIRTDSHICYERMLVNTSSLHDIKNWIGHNTSDPLFYERVAGKFGVLPCNIKKDIDEKIIEFKSIHEELLNSGDIDIFEDSEAVARKICDVYESRMQGKQITDPFLVAISVFEHNLEDI